MYQSEHFDPKSMSDDEILAKMDMLSGRLEWATRFGSAEMAHALHAMLASLEFEYAERINRMIWKERQALFPDVIETDPDAPSHVGPKDSGSEATEKKQNKSRPMITRSSKPVLPGSN